MKITHLFACALLSFVMAAKAAPLSGTKSIGPTGDYASITAAVADVRTQTLGGALVLELQPAYVGSVETFPIAFTNLTTTAANTLTLRPAAGAVALTISSAAAGTVDLNGARFVTIDGRPGGAGSHASSGVGAASQLTIANTSTSGVALRIYNESSSNALRYTTFRGVNTSSGNGVVLFSNTTGINGNDNNTIDHCDIRDGPSTPSVGIYSRGSFGTTEQNSGNTVSNCNIFNFYSGTTLTTAAGVRLDAGTTGWTITGNSFYQTASRAAVAASVRPIYINNTSGTDFKVTGNFIGGSAPNAGGTPWTTTGTAAEYLFQGIRLNVAITAQISPARTTVDGNTIANIVWTSSGAATAVPGVWCGIHVLAGLVNIGAVNGNTIGSGTGTGSITVTTSGSGGTSFGIGSETNGSGVAAIANNTIGSITVNGSTGSVSASLAGIAGGNSVSNNTVGSINTANSLNAANSSFSAIGHLVVGISNSGNVTGNTVANLNNNYIGTAAGRVYGIYNSGATVTGNTVRNLSTTSPNALTNSGQSAGGIVVPSAGSTSNVSQNTVHSIANTAPVTGVSVTGIYVGGSGSTGPIVARNLVHSLSVSSSSEMSVVNGMQFAEGPFTARNNMVRVGVHSDGTSAAGASIVRGIFDQGVAAGRNFYHNSVYVAGNQPSGAQNSFSFVSIDPSSGRSIQNNIFANARSSGGTAIGKHYAVQYGGTIANPAGLTADGNLFFVSGIGGMLGRYNNGDHSTLAVWRVATGRDASSAVADPLFIAPTGDAATLDMHLQASNPAEGGGIPLTDAKTGITASVTDDFDGQTRSALTPTDVGADAGNFSISTDVFAPAIRYPLLTSGSTANRVITGWATIADAVGVAGGASAPRLFYKKSTDADVFGGNTAADNGWKYVIATGSGPYSFTLDYSLIYGGSVNVGDTVQYFVVAQDAANNLGSSPGAATGSATPPVQNVNTHGAVNSFSIVPAISGMKTVGGGGDYTSLTGASGLFAALNGAVIAGDVAIKISGDLTEDGTNGLNEITTNEFPAHPCSITIKPDAATMRTISGASTSGMIRLNGADRVTIDGRFGGAGRYLTFRSAATASTILFLNDASGNTLRDCVVQGAAFGSGPVVGVIAFGPVIVTGNDNNLISGCQVRDEGSDTRAWPYALIGSTIGANSGNVVSNNELFNFDFYGITISGESWTLSNNNIHQIQTSSNISARNGIRVEGGGTTDISDNFFHNLHSAIVFTGTGTTNIARNRITVFNVNAATTDVRGIVANGLTGSTLNVVNNQITLSPATSVSSSLVGIYHTGTYSNVLNAFHNSIVVGGTESGARNSWASFRSDIARSTHISRNNLFLNLRTGTGGGASHFASGNQNSEGTYTLGNNVYAGTGATAVNFMDLGSGGFPFGRTFETWQTATGDTNSQAGLAGTGNFTDAMFVSAATGDLQLVPGGNVLVNALGTPIAGVTTDFYGDFRSATAPTIGSDEFTLPSTFSTWAAANGVANNPNAIGANGVKNLLNFAFGISPITGSVGGLQYAGTFAGNGVIAATGLPVTMVEGADLRALFVRRKNYATESVSYTPQFSADLSMWEASADVPVVLADDGVNQIVGVPFPALIAGQTASFFRLSVSLAP